MTYSKDNHQTDNLTASSGYLQQLTFAGCPSFMRRPFSRDLKDIDLAITGIPSVSYTHLTLPTKA